MVHDVHFGHGGGEDRGVRDGAELVAEVGAPDDGSRGGGGGNAEAPRDGGEGNAEGGGRAPGGTREE